MPEITVDAAGHKVVGVTPDEFRTQIIQMMNLYANTLGPVDACQFLRGIADQIEKEAIN